MIIIIIIITMTTKEESLREVFDDVNVAASEFLSLSLSTSFLKTESHLDQFSSFRAEHLSHSLPSIPFLILPIMIREWIMMMLLFFGPNTVYFEAGSESLLTFLWRERKCFRFGKFISLT